MVTVEQILAAEGEELSRLLGEVLRGSNRVNHQEIKGSCIKCLCRCGEPGWQVECVPKPIPLNWDNAMKWRDWAVKEYGEVAFNARMFIIYIKTINEDGDYDSFMRWIISRAKLEDYLQAAAICKLNSEKGTK